MVYVCVCVCVCVCVYGCVCVCVCVQLGWSLLGREGRSAGGGARRQIRPEAVLARTHSPHLLNSLVIIHFLHNHGLK